MSVSHSSFLYRIKHSGVWREKKTIAFAEGYIGIYLFNQNKTIMYGHLCSEIQQKERPEEAWKTSDFFSFISGFALWLFTQPKIYISLRCNFIFKKVYYNIYVNFVIVKMKFVTLFSLMTQLCLSLFYLSIEKVQIQELTYKIITYRKMIRKIYVL